MLQGVENLLWSMLDGKQNLTSTGYKKARALAMEFKRALCRGHQSEEDAFVTKVLYQVNYIHQDMYNKIKQSITRSMDAYENTMVFSEEWPIARDRHLRKLFGNFVWQKCTIRTPPPLLALLESPNRSGYNNYNSVVSTYQAPKRGARLKKLERRTDSNLSKLKKRRRRQCTWHGKKPANNSPKWTSNKLYEHYFSNNTKGQENLKRIRYIKAPHHDQLQSRSLDWKPVCPKYISGEMCNASCNDAHILLFRIEQDKASGKKIVCNMDLACSKIYK